MNLQISQSDLPLQTIGFLLVPGFPLMSYASAVEPLRAANLFAGKELFKWHHITPEGDIITASCGATVPCPISVGDEISLDLLLVCAGGDPASFHHPPTFAWLRRLANRGIRIGGISGGPFILARAGIMQGRHMTIHWEHAPALTEAYPDLMLTRSLYIADRNRLTCAGGVAPLDMMHALIAEHCGADFAMEVSDWFLHTEIRPAGGPQRTSLSERYGIHRQDLITALELMENNLSDPLSRGEVAVHINLSTRQLDRLFEKYIGNSFATHYRTIRLQRARDLLRASPLAITDIALACGFSSLSHFSRAFRQAFGAPPRSLRQNKQIA